MKHSKISTRIWIGYITVGVFFMLTLAVALFFLGELYLDLRQDNAMKRRLEQAAVDVDMQLNTAQEVVNSLYWDAEIRTLASLGAEQVDESTICRIVRTRTDSAMAKHMTVYVSLLEHSLDSVFGPERATGALSFLKTEGFGSVSTLALVSHFKTNMTDQYFRLMEDGSGAPGSRLAIVERKMYAEKPIYFFVFVDLESIVRTESAEDVMLIMDEDQLLACSNYRVGEPRQNVYRFIDSAGDFSALADGVYVEDNYRYMFSASKMMSWYYVLATPNTFFTQLRWNYYLVVLAIWLAVLLLWLLLVSILKKYAYVPLADTVKALSTHARAPFQNEKQYICATVQDLVNTIDALTLQEQAHRQSARIEQMRYMLRGIPPEEEMLRDLETAFCEGREGPYRVCLLEFSKYAKLWETFSEEMLLEIRRQVVAFIGQELKDSMVALPMIMDYKSFVVIVSGMDMRTLRAKLMNVAAVVDASFEAELAGAVGDLCERLGDVDSSYASALKILESHYSLGSRNAIVTSDDVVLHMGGSSLYYPIDAERELIAEVIRCHEDEVAMLLTQILDENFDKHPLTKERLNSFAFSIASTINRVADALGKTTQDIFGEGNIVFLDLKMCTDKMELRGKVYGMFNDLLEYVRAQTPDTERDTSALMLEYIHIHYNEDISLSDLSAEFSLSLSYTSTLFKEVTGENFKDYLNRYRIKRACDILAEEQGIKNTELAKRVGFNTVATLLRLFNKYEGTTPGQYGKKE